MAITVPKAGDALSVEVFGKPVADAVNRAPLGILARATKTDTQASIPASYVDLTGLLVTCPVVAGRSYKVSVHLTMVYHATAVSLFIARITTGTDVSLAGAQVFLQAGAQAPLVLMALHQPTSSATFTAKVRLYSSTAGGQSVSAADQPSLIMVEDLGVM